MLGATLHPNGNLNKKAIEQATGSCTAANIACHVNPTGFWSSGRKSRLTLTLSESFFRGTALPWPHRQTLDSLFLLMQKISLSTGGASAAIHEVAYLAGDKWAVTNGVGDRTAVWAIGGAAGKFLHRLGTLFIMCLFPVIAVFMWHINEHCDGSVIQLATNIFAKGGFAYIAKAYPRPSMAGLGYIAGFGILQAVLQITVPGKRFHGPTTPKGNVPMYIANGVQCYLLTIALFFATWYMGVFHPSRVYDSMGTIISTSNLFSLVLCGFLYAKGRWFPSSSDSGSTGSLIFDYYWGTELFPRLFGQRFDIKVWTNCRMGMAGWGIITLCYAAKQSELLGLPSSAMLVSVGLMHLYIFKFFLWETGYFASMDIAHDRAGFYLCWGCLVWVPAVYTSPAQWLVRRPGTLSPAGALLTFLAGAIAIYINYDSDRQRQYFRATRGKAPIWGKPPRKIAAFYTALDGVTKESLLLASGWWGLARHFHYVPEVLAALIWSCPGGCSSPVQLIYVAFLTSLLADRAYRDDERCRAKYGKYWELYCEYVPYRVIPLIF